MNKSTDSGKNQKRVTITSKRQFTIPQKYYSELGFDKEAICTLGDGFLVIQPVKSDVSGEFAEQILAELIVEGFSGQELLTEFKKRQSKIRPGIEAILKEAKEIAKGNAEYSEYKDVFGSEE